MQIWLSPTTKKHAYLERKARVWTQWLKYNINPKSLLRDRVQERKPSLSDTFTSRTFVDFSGTHKWSTYTFTLTAEPVCCALISLYWSTTNEPQDLGPLPRRNVGNYSKCLHRLTRLAKESNIQPTPQARYEAGGEIQIKASIVHTFPVA